MADQFDAKGSRVAGMIGFTIRRAQLAIFRDFLAATDGIAVTPAQFCLLSIVAERPGLKQIALSEALEVKRANLATMLDALEVRGLILRRVPRGDARSHAVELTAAGHDMLHQLEAMVAAHEAKITRGLDPAALHRLRALLETMIANCQG